MYPFNQYSVKRFVFKVLFFISKMSKTTENSNYTQVEQQYLRFNFTQSVNAFRYILNFPRVPIFLPTIL